MVGETVTLTRHEAALAAQVGVRREREAIERRRDQVRREILSTRRAS